MDPTFLSRSALKRARPVQKKAATAKNSQQLPKEGDSTSRRSKKGVAQGKSLPRIAGHGRRRAPTGISASTPGRQASRDARRRPRPKALQTKSPPRIHRNGPCWYEWVNNVTIRGPKWVSLPRRRGRLPFPLIQ